MLFKPKILSQKSNVFGTNAPHKMQYGGLAQKSYKRILPGVGTPKAHMEGPELVEEKEKVVEKKYFQRNK